MYSRPRALPTCLFLFIYTSPHLLFLPHYISLSLRSLLCLSSRDVKKGMAVQSQYPTTNAFAQDFRNRSRNDVFEEIRQLHGRDRQHLGAYAQLNNNGDTMAFSDHPKSELTCNAPVSKKRCRDQLPSISMAFNQQDEGIILLPFGCPSMDLPPTIGTAMQNAQSRMYGSTGTSTSGRPEAVSTSPPAVSPLAQGVVSHLYNQSAEIDALIHLQTERLRLGLQEARKRHCRALLSAVEQQVVMLLREKELELESANRMNSELEERVRQVAEQSQMWFNVAKNNEAVVSSLRATIEQVLLQNSMAFPVAAPTTVLEGYGDSDDARSCCFEGDEGKKTTTDAVGDYEEAVRRDNEELRARRACRACRMKEVSVLLLPCRHLCLCKDCESKHETCPVCHSPRNASLCVFLS